MFLNKYSTLYNSVSFEQEAMNDLLIINGKDIITHDANIDDMMMMMMHIILIPMLLLLHMLKMLYTK